MPNEVSPELIAVLEDDEWLREKLEDHGKEGPWNEQDIIIEIAEAYRRLDISPEDIPAPFLYHKLFILNYIKENQRYFEEYSKKQGEGESREWLDFAADIEREIDIRRLIKEKKEQKELELEGNELGKIEEKVVREENGTEK